MYASRPRYSRYCSTKIASPLLDVSIEGVRSVIFNVAGGPDVTLAEMA